MIDNHTNAALVERRNRACPQGLPSRSGVYAARAQGAELWDVEGSRYIDFIGGIGVLNVGHRHPRVVAAIEQQLQAFTHTCFGIAQYETYVALCERYNKLAPGATPMKTVLFNSGAEAVENAVKFARQITGRAGVIAFSGAFHGRTLLATTLCGKALPYKAGFGPLVPAIYHAAFPSGKVDAARSLEDVARIFKTEIPAAEVAAILVEPVQGEGGFHMAPPEFMQELRRLCDAHGICLIVDEVQCGFGRTGRFFAHEAQGIEADMICIAKSMAGGMPLSGVIGKADLLDSVAAGSMGSTYGGNPLACAAALAVLDVIESEGLLQRAVQIGDRIRASWTELRHKWPQHIASVRVIGAMAGLEMQTSEGKPNGALVAALLKAVREEGVLTTAAGGNGEVLRTLVPLIVSDALLEEGLAKIARALDRVCEA